MKIKNNSHNTRFIVLTFIAICFLATGGIFVKLSSLPPISTGFYRILFSIPLLFPFIKIKNINVSKKEFFLIILSGVFLALGLVFWNLSFHMTTIANANLLANMVPFTIIPISYFIYKKRFDKIFYVGLFVTLLGIFTLMSGKIHPNIENFNGDIFAFLTSIFYGLFLLTVSQLRERLDAKIITFIGSFGSLITLFIAMISIEGFYYPKTTYEFLPLLGLTILSQILGQGLLSYCMGKIDVSLSSILVLSQPVIAAIYSFIIFKEILSKQEILGIVIVLSGIILSKKSLSA